MASGRRRGVESSATRAILIDAAAQLIEEQGYPAVTARRVASRAGLKPQLVHYYFKTMDDLFVAVIRKGGEMMLEQVAIAVASEQPLRALWALGRDNRSATLSMEFLALAIHRKAVQAEVKRFSEQIRIVLTAGLTRHFQERGYTPAIEPIVAIVLMSSASQTLMLEAALGIALGHGETQRFIEGCLLRSEQAGKPAAPQSTIAVSAATQSVTAPPARAAAPAVNATARPIKAAAPPAAPVAPQRTKRYTAVQRRKSRNSSTKS